MKVVGEHKEITTQKIAPIGRRTQSRRVHTRVV